MNPQQVGRLFQKFSQVNENTTKRQMGTGLGLWITKELCELMKGDNKVSSIEGVGTSFVFLIKTWSFFDENQNTSKKKRQHLNTRLNYEIDPSNETRKDIAYQYRALSSLDCRRLKPNAFRRVLIAEDLVYNQEIYKRMLKKEGFEVVIANDGVEVVKISKKSPPRTFQFLLFDLNMPNLDGIAASKEIREYEAANRLKSTEIIIATGHCTQEARDTCLSNQGPVRTFDVLI